jgi:hypothetical protein
MKYHVRLVLSLLAWTVALALAGASSPAGAQNPGPPAADTSRAPRQAAPMAPDSIIDILLQLEGYTPIQYQGTHASFRADSGILRLEGSAQVERQGDRLTADTIVYWQNRQLVKALGKPTVTGQAQALEGNVLFYDLERRRAMVEGGRTTIAQGATWYVQGDYTAEGTERLYAVESTFTSDDRPEPQYHFQADKIAVIRDRILVGRPARLYFKNVPVFWLPFIVQDLTRGRRSGLLTPEFSLNDIVRTSSGYTREISNVGFYWAINDYLGAQVAGRWRSDTYTGLLGSLQYRWRERFLNGNLSVEQFWEETGSRRLTLQTSNSWQPDERTRLSLNGNYASSSQFVREVSTDPREIRQSLRSAFSLDRRFDWGTVNLGATRSQSVADDRVDTELPSLGINLKPITLFPASPTEARWYNNASLNLGTLTASRATVDVANDSITRARRLFDTDRTQFRTGPSLTVGNLSLNTSASLNREVRPFLAGIGPFTELPRLEQDVGSWRAGISYRIPLIGSTYLSPNVSLNQDFRRDSISTRFTDDYVTAPLRYSVGTGINPDFYGFFPGIGPYSAIRHHLSPGISYSYSPQVNQTPLQDSVFGRSTAQAQNVVTVSLTQTFEAKLRTPTTAREPQPQDTLADTTGISTTTTRAAPAQPQKVQLLGITTSAIGYDFVRASKGESGFIGETLRNSVRSDFLRGLNLDFTHDLFDNTGLDLSDPQQRGRLGKFAPHLSQVNASFSFGQGSAIFRWVGSLFGLDEEVGSGPGVVPGAQPQPQAAPPGSPTFTQNAQALGGGGPWNVQLSYALNRPRPTGLDTDNGTGTGSTIFQALNESQTVNGTVSFSPTANWAVNWNTSYSVTEGKFADHTLRLRRNLYRWQADFDFTRTITGNTAFSVLVRLTDLPDLKLDYRERDLGGSAGAGVRR